MSLYKYLEDRVYDYRLLKGCFIPRRFESNNNAIDQSEITSEGRVNRTTIRNDEEWIRLAFVSYSSGVNNKLERVAKEITLTKQTELLIFKSYNYDEDKIIAIPGGYVRHVHMYYDNDRIPPTLHEVSNPHILPATLQSKSFIFRLYNMFTKECEPCKPCERMEKKYYCLSYARSEFSNVAYGQAKLKFDNAVSEQLYIVHNRWPDIEYVWVDQICIDQNNIEEVSKTVPYMWWIYQHAEGVLVVTKQLEKETVIGIQKEMGFIPFFSSALPDSYILPALKEMQYIVKLGKIEYFRRSWTAQELLLAKKLVLCTPDSWLDLAGVMCHTHDILVNREKLLGAWEQYIGRNLAELARMWYRRFDRLLLADIINLGNTRKAGKLADRIYGLISLLPRLGIEQIDNNKNLEEATRWITVLSIKQGDFSWIGWTGRGNNWLPSIDSTIPEHNIVHHNFVSGKTLDIKCTSIKYDLSNDSILTLYGKVVAKVIEVVELDEIIRKQKNSTYSKRTYRDSLFEIVEREVGSRAQMEILFDNIMDADDRACNFGYRYNPQAGELYNAMLIVDRNLRPYSREPEGVSSSKISENNRRLQDRLNKFMTRIINTGKIIKVLNEGSDDPYWMCANGNMIKENDLLVDIGVQTTGKNSMLQILRVFNCNNALRVGTVITHDAHTKCDNVHVKFVLNAARREERLVVEKNIQDLRDIVAHSEIEINSNHNKIRSNLDQISRIYNDIEYTQRSRAARLAIPFWVFAELANLALSNKNDDRRNTIRSLESENRECECTINILKKEIINTNLAIERLYGLILT